MPAGLVFESQQPFILSNLAEDKRWPRLQELARPYGVQSFCWLPLTTARRRLGTLTFSCKQPAAYDAASDLPSDTHAAAHNPAAPLDDLVGVHLDLASFSLRLGSGLPARAALKR